MYNQWMYPEVDIRERSFHSTHPYARKFCGCMSLRGGGTLSCFIWLGLNLYGAVLSFQGRSPIYSYLDYNALMIQGAVCILFIVAAFFSLFALFMNKPAILRQSHRTMWVVVFIFITDLFVNIIIFGVQRPNFSDWCIDASRQQVQDQITNNNGTVLDFTPNRTNSDLYNCDRLWQDELKFAIVLFIMITICFIYWAVCLWSYTQKQIYLLHDQFGRQMAAAAAAGAAGAMPYQNTMMNIKPSSKEVESRSMEDGQKSLAQLFREAVEDISSAFKQRK
ncbi:hypothetical protein VTP01DRAFT_4375 [Rhizomucor pusillus]|uniref:uncharacterized protein n=1 Tax=Rhizomucor pusillus TaxID=4840 RepID=UPI003744A80F